MDQYLFRKPTEYRSFLIRLTKWHEKHRRDYPWRKHNSLYELLLAEILLQRTNATKAESVFNKIIKAYPKPSNLGSACPTEIRKFIEPLGLPSRANVLIDLGSALSNHSENWSKENLMKLKGVGPYIAGAVLIHQYGKRTGLLDPNIIRIYERIFRITSNQSRPRNDRKLLELSKSLLPSRNISNYIYGLLDFGALVCKARHPCCDACPMFKKVCRGINK